MSSKELLPCPFCSGEAKYDNSDGYDYIICDECGARTFGFNKEHAFDEWNNRAKYVNNVNNEENVVVECYNEESNETEDLLEVELRIAQKKIKTLERKIQKLLERENDWVTCPSQQFKRCEHVKGIREND